MKDFNKQIPLSCFIIGLKCFNCYWIYEQDIFMIIVMYLKNIHVSFDIPLIFFRTGWKNNIWVKVRLVICCTSENIRSPLLTTIRLDFPFAMCGNGCLIYRLPSRVTLAFESTVFLTIHPWMFFHCLSFLRIRGGTDTLSAGMGITLAGRTVDDIAFIGTTFAIAASCLGAAVPVRFCFSPFAFIISV